MKNIVLASQSPRRKELLTLITKDFIVHSSHVDETYEDALLPHEVVMYLSKIKAENVAKEFNNHIVIGCDTIVTMNNVILGKPKNEKDAYETLKYLSGDTHRVLTGVTIIESDKVDTFYSETNVTFYDLDDHEIQEYIETNDPFDKAGAYGIQGYAAKFVKSIKGDYHTVVGLPVGMLYQKLKNYS